MTCTCRTPEAIAADEAEQQRLIRDYLAGYAPLAAPDPMPPYISEWDINLRLAKEAVRLQFGRRGRTRVVINQKYAALMDLSAGLTSHG